MNQYPAWKYLLISLVLLVGLVYALPNLFGEDPALQVTSARGFAIPLDLDANIEDALVVENLTSRTRSGPATGCCTASTQPKTSCGHPT